MEIHFLGHWKVMENRCWKRVVTLEYVSARVWCRTIQREIVRTDLCWCCIVCCESCTQCRADVHVSSSYRVVTCTILCLLTAFSALTMLVGRQEQHPVCKNWAMRSWHGYLSGARCIWSSWCYCHPVICRFIKIQIGSTFLLPAYPDCPGKEAVKPVSCLFGRCLLWFTRNMSAFIPWLMSTLCAVG